jgi:hypothetical protein
VTLTWSQALAWRLRQHFLEPIGTGSVADVVGRLGAVQAQVAAAADLSIRLRRRRSRLDDVDRALAEGRVIKSWAFRGALHLMTAEDGGVFLALRSASRMWERSSWQTYYRLTPTDWPAFRAAVREALAEGPLTREELGAAVTARPRFRHLGFAFAKDAGTLLKPLCWQGDMSFGPMRDGRHTFQLLEANPRWAGLPELDDAGQRAVESYLRAYGPATVDHLRYWLAEGLGAGKRIGSWIADLGDRLATVEIDGESALILEEDLADLAATPTTDAVRLLPGYDQWVLGPGTADRDVVPPARRSLVSRQASIVIVGGVVSGTWTVNGNQVAITPFAEAEPLPAGPLAQEVTRLGTILGRPLEMTVRSA